MRGGDGFDFWDIDEELYNAIRAAELAAEGAALRARAWAALVHGAALVLLGASLLLGIAMLTLPILRPWYGQAVWVFLLGFACYLLIVAIVYWLRPTRRSPEVRELLRLRRRIAALHVELQRRPGARPNAVLIRKLDDAVRLLDEHLIPALQELVERRANLQRDLRRYERGEIRAPSPEMLRHLHEMLEHQNAAIDGCVQQAANAYAALIALLQVANDEDVANRAQEWAEGLATLYNALVDVLRGDDAPVREDAEVQGQDAEQANTEADDAGPAGTEMEPVEREPEPAEIESPPVPRASPVDREFQRQVREALGCLRDLGRLGRCDLITSLPCTIAATLRERRNGHLGDPTSLEQAQALREILIAAVERLRPEDESPDDGGGAVSGYRVLRLLYLEGKTIEQVEAIVHVANRTVYRYRDSAVEVVACELRQREERHKRDSTNGHGPD